MTKIPFDKHAWHQKIRDNNLVSAILAFAGFCFAVILLIIASALS